MQTRILVWARPVAAVLIVLLAGGAAPAVGLLAPYFLATQTANILLLTISAVASFALWAWAGTGWPDNASFQNLVAWSWMHDDERYLIAVNLSDCPVQAQVQVQWADAGGTKWHLIDLLSGVTYERDGDGMRSPGLYVELTPWNYHFFQCLRTVKD
jgi:hypothetical protein